MFRWGRGGPALIFGTFPDCFQKTFSIWFPLWRPWRNYNMDAIYSAISRRHDMTKICSHFTYLQFVSKKWDSAHENVGGSGSGKCLLCQRLVHQSRHEVTPPVDHGCPFFFMSSHWSLRRRDQGVQVENTMMTVSTNAHVNGKSWTESDWLSHNIQGFLQQPGWQKLRGSTGGTRRKVWTRTKILSPNIRYFVAN